MTVLHNVADLLQRSREAHGRYRRAVAAKSTDAAIDDHVRQALDARMDAHGLDPEHAHPAWQADPAPHDALVAFYRQRLGRA